MKHQEPENFDVRTTLKIPFSLWRRLKEISTEQRKPLYKVVNELLRRQLT